MIIDFLCSAVLGLWAYLGWRRGFLLSAFGIASLLLSYLGAYLLYRPVGDLIASSLGLQTLLAYPLGGIVAFVLIGFALSLVRWSLRRRRREALARGGAWLLPGRIAGAVLSTAYAAGFLLVLVCALSWLQASFPESAINVRSSLAGRAAAPVMAALARRLAGGPTGSPALVGVAERLARDPGGTTESLAAVLADPRVRKVVGAPGSAQRTRTEAEALRKLAADPAFQERAEKAGLLQRAEAGPLSPDEVQVQLAARLAPLHRAVDALSRDKEVRKLLEDPSMQERLRKRDLVALANDPSFNAVAKRVIDYLKSTGPVADGVVVPSQPQPEPKAPPRRDPEKHLYRWTDRAGRVHYGNHPPSGVSAEEVEPPL
jgi:uncharacterized membrane protein required for colicin V production